RLVFDRGDLSRSSLAKRDEIVSSEGVEVAAHAPLVAIQRSGEITDRLGVLLAQTIEQFGPLGCQDLISTLAVKHVHILEPRRGECPCDVSPLFDSGPLYRHTRFPTVA